MADNYGSVVNSILARSSYNQTSSTSTARVAVNADDESSDTVEIRVGDIQRIDIEIHNINVDAVQKVGIAGINNNNYKFRIPTKNVLINTWHEEDDPTKMYMTAGFLVDKNIAWSLEPGTLELQVKINFMPDINGDGIYEDGLVDSIGTSTTSTVTINILPTLFERGDVDEGQ